eukprot:gene8498-10082_t
MFGHAEVVKLLVDCPAVDVNLKGRYHCTALMQAANEGKEELVKLLLACPRVDVHFRNRNGYTAHTWASDKGIKDVIQAHIDALVPQKTGEPGIYDISVIDSNVQETSTIDVTGCTEDALEQQYSFASNDAHTVPATESESGHLRLSPVQDVSPSSPPDETLFETFKDVSVTEPSRSPQTNEESLEVTAQDRAALDTSFLLKVSAHDRALEVLVNKQKECPSLFWFYPKKREMRNWLSDPMKCLFQNTLMMVVVCPVTLRVVKCGPDGVGWEISTPKTWVKEWGPAILMSIYVMQAAVIAGRVVGIPLPQLPSASAAANALGLNCDTLIAGMEDMVNQEQLMNCLDTFTSTTETVLGEQDAPMQLLCAKMHAQRKQQQKAGKGAPVELEEITLGANLPSQMFDASYKSIHTFLTTGENAKLGKLEDQLRGSMERVMAEDGDVEWVSVEAVPLWKQKHARMKESCDTASQTSLISAVCVGYELVTTPPLVASPSLTLLSSSWLAVRLRQKGVREELIVDCEQKLVFDEDHSEVHLLAALSSEQFTAAYLDKIGIKALGLQQKLLGLHQELVQQHHPSRGTVTTKSHTENPSFASTETTTALEKKLEALTKELTQLKASSVSGKSTDSPLSNSTSGGGGRGGGQQQALKQRTDTSTAAINPRTRQLYTLDELVLEIQLMKSDIGALSTDVDIIKETF